MTYYKAIKLKNGELMACSVLKDLTFDEILERRAVVVTNPVIFHSFKFMDTDGELVETISMMPMIPISDNEELELRTDHIFSMADMRAAAAERYQAFLVHLREVQEQEAKEEAAEQQQQVIEDAAADNVVIGQFNNKLFH